MRLTIVATRSLSVALSKALKLGSTSILLLEYSALERHIDRFSAKPAQATQATAPKGVRARLVESSLFSLLGKETECSAGSPTHRLALTVSV